jgi:Uma2 family endonuclease
VGIRYAPGMTSPANKRATYADLQAVPSDKIAEILDGALYTQPRPASLHAFAVTGLAADITAPFQRGRGGPGGWIILFEPELHLGEDVLVPDIAGWRRERMPKVPDTPAFTLAPDWVCEALSPGTAGRDRTIKLEIYRREGVKHLWFLDPIAKTLEVLRLDGEGYRLAATFAGDAKVRAEPFDAVELELGHLWLPSAE